MTTIANVRYNGGRITGADSRATSPFRDYEDTFEKTFTLNGSNVLVQIAGSVPVAESTAAIIVSVMASHPKDDIENHMDEIRIRLETLSKRLKEEQTRAAALMGARPADDFAELIITVSDGKTTRSFLAEAGVAYESKETYIDAGNEIKGSQTMEPKLLNGFEKLRDDQAIAVGPDPRSPEVLNTILSCLPDASKMSEDEARAAVLALIKTFADNNEGVNWPIHEWRVEDRNPVPLEFGALDGEQDVTGAQKELLEHITPLARAAFDVVTIKEIKRYFERELDAINAKIDDDRAGKVMLSKEDRQFLNKHAIQDVSFISQIGTELAHAEHHQKDEAKKLRQYIRARDATRAAHDLGQKALKPPEETKALPPPHDLMGLRRRGEALPTPESKAKSTG